MKRFATLIFLLFPLFLFGQNADSLAVVREVDSLIQVSRELTGKQEFEKALEVNAAAETLVLKRLGKGSAAYGSCCFNRGLVSDLKGDYLEAEKWYLESKSIWEQVLGRQHPDYARSLHNIATLYIDMGNYEKAEPLFLESKSIREKVLGKQHIDYARSLNNFSVLYWYMGKLEEAESLCLEAKAIREKEIGKEHPDYAHSLNNLALLYQDMGNFEEAEPLLLEAKAIREKALGKTHFDYANSLLNLSGLYWYMGKFEKAEPLNIEAIAIHEKTLGKEHLYYAGSLLNLAILYQGMGKFEKAEPLHLEAKAIREKALGKEHPANANSLLNLASLYQNMGDFEKAEPLSLEAKAIREKILGKEHPYYVISLNNLASLYLNMHNFKKAEPLFLEQATANQSLIVKAMRHLSERELNRYLNTFAERQTEALSFAQLSNSKKVIPASYDNTLFYKGFTLQSANEIKRLALTDSISTEKYNLLKSYHRRLEKQYALPIAERDSAKVAELEEKANTLEKDLARTVAGFGEALRQVKWNEVRDVLKPGEAAVEFVHYQYHAKKPTDSIMYAALVLRPGDEAPQFVPLFEERDITPLLEGASGRADQKINALYSTANGQKSPYDLIWKPLETHLQGVETVYCSPSGLLHRLNLSAISNEPDREIVVLGSTRRLVLPDAAPRTGTDAVLVGGIRYASDTTAIAAANAGIAARNWSTSLPFHADTTATRGDNWQYLPESATEVRDIQNVLQAANWSVQLDTGYLATEEVIRSIGNGKPSPRILHIATHGFFYPDPKEAPSSRRRLGEAEPVFKLSEHPMIRSGLLLAGADEAWKTGKTPENREDGILTAYEISQMNLAATELVVLSACETGLGDIEGNEGVYGLQRAFKIAGAKYLIMSLWKVSDKSTRELMTDFYRQWLEKGISIPEAFRTAQGNMKAKYPDAPYLWAGFVLVE